MPRYFFHIRNGLGFTEDEEGRELPAEEAARQVAVEGARSLLSEEVCGGTLDLRGRIDVADESGTIVVSVPFGEVVTVQTGELPDSEADAP